MKANCPNCASFQDEPKTGPFPHVDRFTIDGKTWHAVPDIWLAGRMRSLERNDPELVAEFAQEQGSDALAAYRLACRQWAWHCGIETAREAVERAS